MSTLSWPKTIAIGIIVMLVAVTAGLYAVGQSARPPEQTTVNKVLDLPGGNAASMGAAAGVALPEMPSPQPLPGSSQPSK